MTTPDIANLCERLRDRAAFCKDCGGVTTYDEGDSALDNEAADLIERLDAMLADSPQGAVPTKREAALAELAKLDGETMDLAASPQGEGSSAGQDALIEKTCRECRALHRIVTEGAKP
jgi:hypothetical protein